MLTSPAVECETGDFQTTYAHCSVLIKQIYCSKMLHKAYSLFCFLCKNSENLKDGIVSNSPKWLFTIMQMRIVVKGIWVFE